MQMIQDKTVKVCQASYITSKLSCGLPRAPTIILRVKKSLVNISRFNVDCAASAGLYSAAEGAFGTSGAGGEDVGECPAPGNR